MDDGWPLKFKILAALLLWNNLTVSEQLWIKGSEQKKPHLKTEMKVAPKLFDRQMQTAKCKLWRQQQEHLLDLPSENTLKIRNKTRTPPYYTHGSGTEEWVHVHRPRCDIT